MELATVPSYSPFAVEVQSDARASIRLGLFIGDSLIIPVPETFYTEGRAESQKAKNQQGQFCDHCSHNSWTFATLHAILDISFENSQ